MTIEERLDRIGLFTAGEAEQRRRERDEDRALWRDAQRQLNSLTLQIVEVDQRLGDRIEQLAEEIRKYAEEARKYAADSRAADAALGERVSALVSSIGEFISKSERSR